MTMFSIWTKLKFCPLVKTESYLSYSGKKRFNSFPNDKILDLSKFKAFADDKINVTKICFGKGRKHCGGKGENSGY